MMSNMGVQIMVYNLDMSNPLLESVCLNMLFEGSSSLLNNSKLLMLLIA